MDKKQQYIIYALAQNEPGVLNRVFSLFRRRRFNIESATAGHTHQPKISRFTIVVNGSKYDVDQVIKQMYKILEITKVVDISEEQSVVRELALVKVKANKQTRSEIIQIVDIFRAKIVDVATNSLIIEITGTQDKIDSLVNLLHKFGIKEVVRTGATALTRN